MLMGFRFIQNYLYIVQVHTVYLTNPAPVLLCLPLPVCPLEGRVTGLRQQIGTMQSFYLIQRGRQLGTSGFATPFSPPKKFAITTAVQQLHFGMIPWRFGKTWHDRFPLHAGSGSC